MLSTARSTVLVSKPITDSTYPSHHFKPKTPLFPPCPEPLSQHPLDYPTQILPLKTSAPHPPVKSPPHTPSHVFNLRTLQHHLQSKNSPTASITPHPSPFTQNPYIHTYIRHNPQRPPIKHLLYIYSIPQKGQTKPIQIYFQPHTYIHKSSYEYLYAVSSTCLLITQHHTTPPAGLWYVIWTSTPYSHEIDHRW